MKQISEPNIETSFLDIGFEENLNITLYKTVLLIYLSDLWYLHEVFSTRQLKSLHSVVKCFMLSRRKQNDFSSSVKSAALPPIQHGPSNESSSKFSKRHPTNIITFCYTVRKITPEVPFDKNPLLCIIM